MTADDQGHKFGREASGRLFLGDEAHELERDEVSAARRERLLGELVRRGRAGEGLAGSGETVPVAIHQDGTGIPFALDEHGDQIAWSFLPTQAVIAENDDRPVILSIDERANHVAEGPGVIDPKRLAELREARSRLVGELGKMKTRVVYRPRWPEGTRVIDLDSDPARQEES